MGQVAGDDLFDFISFKTLNICIHELLEKCQSLPFFECSLPQHVSSFPKIPKSMSARFEKEYQWLWQSLECRGSEEAVQTHKVKHSSALFSLRKIFDLLSLREGFLSIPFSCSLVSPKGFRVYRHFPWLRMMVLGIWPSSTRVPLIPMTSSIGFNPRETSNGKVLQVVAIPEL